MITDTCPRTSEFVYGQTTGGYTPVSADLSVGGLTLLRVVLAEENVGEAIKGNGGCELVGSMRLPRLVTKQEQGAIPAVLTPAIPSDNRTRQPVPPALGFPDRGDGSSELPDTAVLPRIRSEFTRVLPRMLLRPLAGAV